MKLLDKIISRLTKKKGIDVSTLPSQGYFYKEDFKVWIKKADALDVKAYENGFDGGNLGSVLNRIKGIVEKNTILSEGYSFNSIKSIDIVFLFLEIVRLTKNDSVMIEYYDDELGTKSKIEFCQENFNYYTFDEYLEERWNREERCIEMYGYKFTLPTIGIENSLTSFLIEKSYEDGCEKYNDYSYSFTHFMSDRESLTFAEIENLIEVFNFDIDAEEKNKISDIVEMLKPMQRYTLKKGDRVIEMGAKLNLMNIWK
jgi:hypothetical protein